MKSGNSIQLPLKTGLSLEDVERVEVVFGQRGKIILIKAGEDVELGDGFVTVQLMDEETYLFEPGRYIPVDITIQYEDGVTLTDCTMYKRFDGTVRSQDVDTVQIELDISSTLDEINGEVV